MSYPLRLPPELDAEAREQCARLGISLNAFIAVALDAYLRGGRAGRRSSAPAAARKRASKAPVGGGAEEAGAAPSWLADPDDWRYFHRDPDMWPYVDPEFADDPIWKRVDAETDEGRAAVDAEYWRTRQRPAGA